MQQFGVGWAILPIFNEPTLTDSLKDIGHEQDPSYCPMWKGSPRSLFFLDGSQIGNIDISINDITRI